MGQLIIREGATFGGRGGDIFAILDWLWEGLCIIMGGNNYQGEGRWLGD